MVILGVNAYHADSSAAVVVDGKLVAAAEEERFRRIKHWAGVPTFAVGFCLEEVGIPLSEVDYIALNRNPKSNIGPKLRFLLSRPPSSSFMLDRINRLRRLTDIATILAREFGGDRDLIRSKIRHVQHHHAHMASSFFVSPFNRAVVLSVDGVGDFVSTMWGLGEKNKLWPADVIFFPHSLGFFYLAVTQLLGFTRFGDEYKVMALASFGKPTYLDRMHEIVLLRTGGKFSLNLKYFRHHKHPTYMEWSGGIPETQQIYSHRMEDYLCPARKYDEAITPTHENVAASLQAMYEEALFHTLRYAFSYSSCPNLCLSGGCAMNSVANGKIFDNTPFKDVYIQPAAGDAGGAIGAAFYLFHQMLLQPRSFVLEKSYLGKSYDDNYISRLLLSKENLLNNQQIRKISDEDELCREAAKLIADGNVVGWFEGRMEWGPRALGNRSILADPRRSEMKDILNARIKRREGFRPFAPSILLENTEEYFEKNYPDPFMLMVYKIRKDKQAKIPAVTHVDGTGRLQTVKKEDNPLYWKLIKEFYKLTKIPVVLNTSFNENEPIVNTPDEALDCYLRTNMDVLVLGSYLIRRKSYENS
jgi:carbamoyltransferase